MEWEHDGVVCVGGGGAMGHEQRSLSDSCHGDNTTRLPCPSPTHSPPLKHKNTMISPCKRDAEGCGRDGTAAVAEWKRSPFK